MAVAAVYFSTRGEDVLAAGPCGTSHDAMDAEEQQFLGLLQAWRAGGVSNEPVEISGALNQAAAWFAQWQVTNNALGGHQDSFGRGQGQRAIDCGYTIKTSYGVYWASVAGEGVFSPPPGATSGAQAALAGMVGQQGSQSGIFMTGTQNFPAKCYGVGKYSDGTKTAWVVVIVQQQFNLPCPAGSGGGGTVPAASPSASSTPNTPTLTPTVTPTATPTQKPVFYSWFSQLAKD
jgi:hypothetical protein